MGQVPNGGPLWFLFAYLLVITIYNVLSIGFARKQKILHMAMIVCAFGGAICSYAEILLPFNLNTVFTCLFLFHIGNLSRRMKLMTMKTRFGFLSAFLLLTVIWIISVFLNYGYLLEDNSVHSGSVMLYRNKVGNYFYFMIGYLAAISALAILSRYLSKAKFLQYWGRNSLVIMAFHYPIVMFLSAYFQHTFLKEVFIAIVITGMCCFVASLLRRYCPILIGMKKVPRTF